MKTAVKNLSALAALLLFAAATLATTYAHDRKTIDLGTITITTVDPDSDPAQKALAFDPTRLTDGIKLSDDPLPTLRSGVYRLSSIHRQRQ
jgi:catalase